MLGVPGLMNAYREGNVALANALGTGVADDKAVYAYVPRLIRYYLGEDPILPTSRPHLPRAGRAAPHARPPGRAGGQARRRLGRLRHADRARARPSERARARPGAADGRPGQLHRPAGVELSIAPDLIDGAIEPRHVDLRPFILTGRSTWVLPGGLTRVALRRGSLVVNSSQGGGSKDTWVLAERAA